MPAIYCTCVMQMFFGIVRQSCGGDDHPTPNQFLYVYRLLSVSSLIKPGKRASVQSEPTAILLSARSAKSAERIPFIPAIESLLDTILERDSHQDTELVPVADSIGNTDEHDYVQSTPEECIKFYLGGYVAHKLAKFTTCAQCLESLSDSENITSAAKLVELKTHGGLKLPAKELTALITLLESSFQQYSAAPSTNMYFDILNDVLASDGLSSTGIGCEKHYTGLTARCIHFFITTRLHFLKKSVNRNRKSRVKKQKLSKISKLT